MKQHLSFVNKRIYLENHCWWVGCELSMMDAFVQILLLEQQKKLLYTCKTKYNYTYTYTMGPQNLHF